MSYLIILFVDFVNKLVSLLFVHVQHTLSVTAEIRPNTKHSKAQLKSEDDFSTQQQTRVGGRSVAGFFTDDVVCWLHLEAEAITKNRAAAFSSLDG